MRIYPAPTPKRNKFKMDPDPTRFSPKCPLSSDETHSWHTVGTLFEDITRKKEERKNNFMHIKNIDPDRTGSGSAGLLKTSW